jgi:hypothetical protein
MRYCGGYEGPAGDDAVPAGGDGCPKQSAGCWVNWSGVIRVM